MGLTLRQAESRAGISRSTIHRALKSGKLSGTRAEDGSWSIEEAELARVFPWDVSEPVQRDDTRQARDADAVLTMKVQMLEQQLAREQETIEDLRRRLDRSEDRVLALSAPPMQRETVLDPTPKTVIGRLRYLLRGS